MQTIAELLNKIKWKEKDKKQFKIFYLDRFSDELKEVNFSDIEEMNKFSIVLEVENKEVEIPLHRIRKVYKNETCIWGRE